MRTSLTTVLAGAATLAFAAATLTACGSSSSDAGAGSSAGGGSSASGGSSCSSMTPVTLQLQWSNQSQFAGYYAAKQLGYYSDLCLDVTINPNDPNTPPQQVVENGNADFAVSWAPKVLGDIDNGADLVNVAQIFQRSAPLLVSLKSAGITKPADMAGKKWVNWGYGNQWELLAMLQQAGHLSPAQTKYDAEGDTPTNLFKDGDDAVTAMTYNELALLLETPKPDGSLYQMSDFNILDPNKYGVGMLEDGIWTTGKEVSSSPKVVEEFVEASLKGWIDVRDHPMDGVKYSQEAEGDSPLPPNHEKWMMNEINKLIWPSPQGIGTVDQTEWKHTVSESEKVVDPATGKPLITKAPPASTINTTFVTKALADLKKQGLDVDGTNFKPMTVAITKGGE
jgi:NitT/TauT family transport system substrate-binding protein